MCENVFFDNYFKYYEMEADIHNYFSTMLQIITGHLKTENAITNDED